MPKPDSRSFRRWFGDFATGVTVVSARDRDGGPIGITINSVTSVSLDPPLVLFCLDRKAHIYKMLRNARQFAVNILSDKQENLSRHFSDYRHHPVSSPVWDKPQQDCPVLRNTLGWMICRRTAIYKAGDHDIIVGKTIALHRNSSDMKPLLYFRSRYRKVGD